MSCVLKRWILHCWLYCFSNSALMSHFNKKIHIWAPVPSFHPVLKIGLSGSSAWCTCLVPVPLGLALSFPSHMLQGLAVGRPYPLCHCPVCSFVRPVPPWFPIAVLLWGCALLALSDAICSSQQYLQSVTWPTCHNVLPATLAPSLSLLLIGAHLAGPSQPRPSLQRGLFPGLRCNQSSQDLISPFSELQLLMSVCGENKPYTAIWKPCAQLLFNTGLAFPLNTEETSSTCENEVLNIV